MLHHGLARLVPGFIALLILMPGFSAQEAPPLKPETPESKPEKKSEAEMERERQEQALARLVEDARAFERAAAGSVRLMMDLARVRHELDAASLRIAMFSFVDLLELDDLRATSRGHLHTTIRRVWGPEELGLHEALRALGWVLAREHGNDSACLAVLRAVGRIGKRAAPLARAVQNLDARGRPDVSREKERAIRSLTPRGLRLVNEAGPPRTPVSARKAVIRKVNVGLQYVMLSVGADDGVVRGIRLPIHRKGAMIGEVQVDWVYRGACSASFIALQKGHVFQAGDEARYTPPAFEVAPEPTSTRDPPQSPEAPQAPKKP